MRKTKIICTLGPNAENYDILKKMAEYMDVGRFNFSHGSHEEHLKKLDLLKKIRDEVNRPIAALLDTKGPEIRTKKNKNGEVINLIAGNEVELTIDDVLCDDKIISVTYEGIVKDVKVGDTILIDDGIMELKAKKITDKSIICDIITGGELGERKGVNLPGIKVNLPDLSETDIADIEFGIKEGFDMIAASFVRSANCIKQIRDILNKQNCKMLIIAKIENREGVDNIDEIIDEADGVMVARGDLGIEVKASEVPYLQKQIIKKCNQKGKIVITATQMLDSMIKNPRPTRAEVADVANAIYDGTDAIMLSGETANGKYPVESVLMMDAIAKETESHINNQHRLDESLFQSEINHTITNTVCKSITVAANDLNAKAIVAPTITGHTARVISKFKPNVPIFALSKNMNVVRQLMIYYGVTPMMSNRAEESDAIVGDALVQLRDSKLLKVGDTVVVAFGRSIVEDNERIKSHTNTMRIEEVY